MALFTIDEFPGGPPLSSQVPQHPPIARQFLTPGGASLASQAFNEATRVLGIWTDTKCSYRIGLPGDTPTALITDTGMTAGATIFVGVSPNAKIAVIAIA